MDDLTVQTVLEFIVSNGGRVQNSKLVTHFKDFLNHPVNKAINRQKFKEFIIELATIKVVDGEKILILKGKYSQAAVTPPSSSSASLPVPQDDPISAISGSQMDVDSVDGGMVSKARIDENVEVVKLLGSDRVPFSAKGSNISKSTTGSTGSLISTVSQVSSMSALSTSSSNTSASSTSGYVSMDEDANSSVSSVKDRIKNLNKNISDTDLLKTRPAASSGGVKKIHKHVPGDEDSDTYDSLDKDQKDWLIVCASAEYHDMNKLLHKKPELAKLKDLTNTALHWAAKSGKSEVIKMIASKPGVNVDNRSGFTPLHLAAIHGHEEVMELLVQIYKADVNIRDYSGKKAKQYLRNSSSSKIQQLFLSRKYGSADFFTRSSMRKSNRSKGVSSLFQAMSAVARQPLLNMSVTPSEEIDAKDGNVKTPPGSERSSPFSGRKNPSNDVNLMQHQSDMVTTSPQNSTTGSKSTSREASPSLIIINDENQVIMRSNPLVD